MDVWRPYGWKAMRQIDALTHAEMERTGHEEVNFPLFIPEDLLEKKMPRSTIEASTRGGLILMNYAMKMKKLASKKKSIGSSTLVKMTSISQCSCGQRVKLPCTLCSHLDSKSQRFTTQSVPNGQHISLRNQANSFIYSSS